MSRPIRRTLVAVAAAVAATIGAAAATAPSAAAAPQVTTPYPMVAVQPGSTVSFEVEVASSQVEPVALDLGPVPQGWRAVLRGGGFVIEGVTATPDEPATATVEITVPPDAPTGVQTIELRGSSPSGQTILPLQLTIADTVESAVSLSTDFPLLRGKPTDTFTYTVTITNNTPQEQSFNLQPSGPEGWQVTASPSSESRAAAVTIEAGGNETVRVEAQPPANVEAGTYPIALGVVSASGQRGTLELQAEVTGQPSMQLSTIDERLNLSGEAGSETRKTLVIANDGSAPLEDVQLSATPPSGWEVRFEPESIAQVAPGERAEVVAVIRPAGNAVAGDYSVAVTSSAGSTTSRSELRFTVTTSTWWGVAGIAIIVVAVLALVGVFWRFGRR